MRVENSVSSGVMPVSCAVVADYSDEGLVSAVSALESAGVRVVSTCPDALSAIEAVKKREIDILAVNAILPGGDAGEIAARVDRMLLNVKPAVIGMFSAGMKLPERQGLLWVEKPVTSEAMRLAAEKARVENRVIDPKRRSFLRGLLEKLGVPEHPGREHLIDAAYMLYLDRRYQGRLTSRVYPAIARRASVKPGAVERAMRYAVDRAWRTGNIDDQYDLFKSTIDAGRGKPTCGEMLARLAVSMRMEDEK